MNPTERLELIRAKAQPGQKAAEVVKVSVKRKPGLIVRGSGKPTAYGFGPRLSAADRVVTWIKEVGDTAKEWQPKRRHGPHELTRIAEKLKRKWAH